MSEHDPVRPLTERQLQVARLWADGWTRTEVARELGISQRTVQAHIATIMLRLPDMPHVGSHRRICLYLRSREQHAA